MSILSFWLWIAAIDGNSLFHPLFVPMSADERLSYAPFLIFGLLNLSLAAICFALWRVAPEHKVLRSMGYYLLIASVVPILISIGGDWLHWPLIVLASPLLISAAQDGMRIRFRRLGLILWGFAIVVILIAWLPRFAFLRSWPTDLSQVLLAALVIRAFRRNASGDREMACLFAAYFVVRWLASDEALRTLHLRHSAANYYFLVGGWRWSPLSMFITTLGAMTVGLFIRDLVRDRHEKLRMAAELEAARAVQQVLISEKMPAIPGFTLEAVYRPFSQVGGDFFQILPVTCNSVLVALARISHNQDAGLGAGI